MDGHYSSFRPETYVRAHQLKKEFRMGTILTNGKKMSIIISPEITGKILPICGIGGLSGLCRTACNGCKINMLTYMPKSAGPGTCIARVIYEEFI